MKGRDLGPLPCALGPATVTKKFQQVGMLECFHQLSLVYDPKQVSTKTDMISVFG